MSHVDQIQHRINFYEKSNLAKDKIAKNENERLNLEIELNKLLNSDQALTKSKAIKLKAYYKKLCEDEDKSFRRNQQLLSDLHRIDSQFLQLESKLERLTNLKKECEIYLRTAYPSWTSENKILGINSSETNITKNMVDFIANVSKIDNYQPKLDISQQSFDENSPVKALISSLNLNNKTKLNEELNKETGNILDKVNFSTNQPTNTTIKNLVPNFLNSNSNERKNSLPQTLISNNKQVIEEEKEYNKPNDYIRKLVSSVAMINTNTTTNKNDDDLQQFNTANLNENNLIKEYEKELKLQETNMIDTLARTTSSINNLIHTDMDFNTQNIKIQTHNNNQLNLNTWSSPLLNNMDELPKASSTSKVDDFSIQKNLNNHNENNEINRKGILKPYRSIKQELNLTSLYYLLDYIELEITHTIHPERYYRQVEPHFKTKLEIIKLASDNESLDDMDPADISMVIIDQLASVIRKHTKNKCLFTADFMSLSVADVNNQVVLKHLKDESDKKLWNRLLKHWNFLKKLASMDTESISRIFAPALLSQNSNGSEKSIKFLQKILNNTNQLASSENFNESKSMTETSLNNELVIASNSKLKESSFYQDFINNSTQNSSKSKQIKFENVNDDDDEDENDEIDALVAPKSLMSTTSSLNKPKNATIINNHILKSPRPTGDYDFDFSQSSNTESQKIQPSLKQLNSLRSSADKKQIPVYLRDPDSEDDSENFSEMSNKFKNKSQKSESDFEFYN